MNKRTALFDEHVAAGARMVEFAGWDMPLTYGSQVAEHHAVRNAAGVFDVSHMTVVDIAGSGALAFLRRLLAGDAARLVDPGQAMYTVLLNEAAGIIDDLIAYRLQDGYRLVVNAATRGKVLAWLRGHAAGEVAIAERQLAMLAVQGPAAMQTFARVADLSGLASLARFHAAHAGDWMIARTGYTGEDGVEVMLPNDQAPALWRELVAAGVAQAGLGARDTLRLEAGLNLYGMDMDEHTSPLAANLGWTVHWRPDDRDFIGRRALAAERAAGPAARLAGLALAVKGVMRHGQRVLTSAGEGVVTSGIFSPTLGYSIALARLPVAAAGEVEVLVRDRPRPAGIVRPPFFRRGGQSDSEPTHVIDHG